MMRRVPPKTVVTLSNARIQYSGFAATRPITEAGDDSKMLALSLLGGEIDRKLKKMIF